MSRTIVVDINQSQHAHEFDQGSSFFEEELTRALCIIEDHVRSIPEKTTRHRHETIAVLGGRGLGKTSFVLSLLARAQARLDGKGVKIAPLDILDPTLIERNEIFLATVTAAIVQKLDEHCGDLILQLQVRFLALW